jgi:hypothetical protein
MKLFPPEWEEAWYWEEVRLLALAEYLLKLMEEGKIEPGHEY